MDKLSLIRKEIKDCKLYLNYLYECLKNEKKIKRIRSLKYEISGVSYTKDVLSQLLKDYENGNGEAKLEEIIKENNKEFDKYKNYDRDLSEEEFEELWKIRSLDNSLNIINDNYLSKEEIYEYLNDYNEVMRMARNNINIPIGKVFMTYMENSNQKHKANMNYYQKMIKIHILFVNASVLGVTKDEEFDYLEAMDSEMGEKTKDGGLAFLKEKFIISTDSSRFKKTHVFNFIRNAFFHSDNNDLYKISSDCNFINISLKETNPIPFNVKITANDIFRMSRFIQNYSHHATIFDVPNQEQIVLDNLFSHYHKFSRELDKVSFIRKVLPKGISDRKEDIHTDLYNSKVFSSTELLNLTLNKYGNVKEVEYKFSENQKRLLHSKFKYFEKYLKYIGMKYFVVPIICNYMPSGICKINFLYFDLAVSYTYLFNGNNSFLDIINDVSNDYMNITDNNNLKKKSVFDYIDKDIDISKYGLLYLLDNDEKDNFDDLLLFKYVYGTINKEEKVNIGGIEYESKYLRNAFTHNRWRGYTDQFGKRCFYLYDDEDLIVDPDNAYWKKTFFYEDLKKTSDEIMKNYIDSLNVGKGK